MRNNDLEEDIEKAKNIEKKSLIKILIIKNYFNEKIDY